VKEGVEQTAHDESEEVEGVDELKQNASYGEEDGIGNEEHKARKVLRGRRSRHGGGGEKPGRGLLNWCGFSRRKERRGHEGRQVVL
jgi:hypothetical protein